MCPNSTRSVFGHKSLSYVENDMVEYLSQVEDIIPILILDYSEEKLDFLMSELDGVIFQGGSDVCPETYNEPYLDKERWPGDLFRDKVEVNIFHKACNLGLPIFGICRGAQIINSALKGTLYQDLLTETNTDVQHRDAVLYDHVSHDIKILGDGVFKDIYGTDTVVKINSVHHQGIKKLGVGLIVEARCTKGNLIEAFSGTCKNSEIIAVQWHPEFSHTLGDKLCDPNKLFSYFISKI
jgi:putative glutamine amidotransferase